MGLTGVLEPDFERDHLEPILGGSKDLDAHGIEFAGLLPIGEVFRALHRAAVVVVNCNWEGSTETYCRSALEAQASGAPVVGAARGSLPEVIRDGATGLLVDEPNPSALARAIIMLLKDRALRGRLGTAGQAWARRTAGYDSIAADWEAVAHRAVRDEAAPAPHRLAPDLLRCAGYGRLRLAARRAARALS